MFIKRQIVRREAGDTIVEVLMATMVVMLVLGGAYVTTNRSLQATRAAQERTVALKLAESQIEQIKGLARNNPDAIFGGNGYPAVTTFCISQETGLPVVTIPLDLATGLPTAPSGFDPACEVDASGAHAESEPVYRIAITRDTATNLFTLIETWADVSGRTYNNLQLRYRIYE